MQSGARVGQVQVHAGLEEDELMPRAMLMRWHMLEPWSFGAGVDPLTRGR